MSEDGDLKGMDLSTTADSAFKRMKRGNSTCPSCQYSLGPDPLNKEIRYDAQLQALTNDVLPYLETNDDDKALDSDVLYDRVEILDHSPERSFAGSGFKDVTVYVRPRQISDIAPLPKPHLTVSSELTIQQLKLYVIQILKLQVSHVTVNIRLL